MNRVKTCRHSKIMYGAVFLTKFKTLRLLFVKKSILIFETNMKMKIRNWPIKVPKTLKKRENFVYYCSLPCFSITRKPWNLKACWHLHLTPLSIIITITQTMNLETQIHKTDWNPQITNHDSFELVQVNIHFLIGLLRWLTAVKNWISDFACFWKAK